MKNNISPREYEQLSAYLDGQLNERDRSRLEVRLQSTPELSSALEDLRRTRQLLRSLPPMKAPRSFKLTPEMVGQTRQPRLIFPVFQFASALATLLLVLVLAGDFFGLRFGASQTAYAPVAVQKQNSNSTLAANAPATEQTFSAPQALQSTPYPGPSVAMPLMSSPTGTPGLADTRTAAGLAPEGTQTAPGMLSAESITETTTLSNTAPIAPPASSSGLAGAASATGEAQQDNAVRTAAPESQPALPPVRIAEIILAAAAISFGLAAYLLRRSSGI